MRDLNYQLKQLCDRNRETRRHNIAAVALANKTLRIAWAMMTAGRTGAGRTRAHL